MAAPADNMNFKKNDNMENLKTFAVIARFVGDYEQEAVILETDKNERELLKEHGHTISYLGRYNSRQAAEWVKNRIETRSKELARRLRESKNERLAFELK